MKEEILFDEQRIKVTNTHFTVNGKQMKLSNISEAHSDFKKPNRVLPITLIIISWVLVAIGGIVALILMILGIVWLILQKKIYYIEYKTSNGQIEKIENKDGNLITRIFDALEKAIMNYPDEEEFETGNIDKKAVDEFYDELMSEIDEIDINGSIKKAEDTITISKKLIKFVAENITTNCGFSVDQKCRLLEAFNKKMLSETVPGFYNVVFTKIILISYETLDSIVPCLSTMSLYEKIKQQNETKQPISFQDGFYDLFCIAGLIGSENGEFSLNSDILDNYNLPEYRNKVQS